LAIETHSRPSHGVTAEVDVADDAEAVVGRDLGDGQARAVDALDRPDRERQEAQRAGAARSGQQRLDDLDRRSARELVARGRSLRHLPLELLDAARRDLVAGVRGEPVPEDGDRPRAGPA
jgi:hypothetical protein